MLRIHLFGALRLDDDERSLPFVALPKVLPLWAYLLLHHDEAVSRDALAFVLWPDTTETQAKANLRRHLYDLRRVLPEPPVDTPWLLITPQTVQWNPRASYWLDVGAFEQLSRIPDCLPAAIELYVGPLLAGLDEEWLWFERERLHALYLNTLRQSMALHRQKGDLAAAMQDAQRGLADDPLREDFVREQVALQYALGDRAGALQAYRQFAQALKVELGAPPMPETQELARLMLHNAPARQVLGLPDSDLDPSLGSVTAPPPGNVTAPVRLLVGRDELVAAVEQMLGPASSVRLVTLTGPGGIGKTRLAHEVAFRFSQQRPDHFQHGVVTVALAAVQDPEFVLPAMVAALGVRAKADIMCLDGLIDFLRYRRMLLVLDNFEHVLPAAESLNALLKAAPGLRLLVTSQVLLNLYGEHEIGVTPLALADPQHLLALDQLASVPAVALFCEGARAAAGPHFELDEGNAAAVAEVCLRLDGVPLAIELAAARSKLFTPAEIVQQLDHALDALRSRAVDVPERHRTLRAALEWSYGLLDPDEKQLFARLALFPGGFTTESVAALMDITPAAALGALERLLEKNIIRLSQHKTGPQPRFLMLAVLRAYAEEWQRSDEAIETLCLRRAQYFAVLAEQVRAGLLGKNQGQWLDRIVLEENNLRASLAWSFRENTDSEAATLGWELIRGVQTEYWVHRDRLAEGQSWQERAWAHRALLPVRAQSVLLQRLSWYETLAGNYDLARQYAEDGLRLARLDKTADLIGASLQILGTVAGHVGNFREAEALFLEAIALESATSPDTLTYNLAVAYNNLGIVLKHLGEYERAIAVHRRMLEHRRAQSDHLRLASTLRELGDLMVLTEQYDEASRLYAESLQLRRQLDDRRGMWLTLSGVEKLLRATGRWAESARLSGAILDLAQRMGLTVAPEERREFETAIAMLRQQLGEAEFVAAWSVGTQLTLEQAVETAAELLVTFSGLFRPVA